MGEHGTLGKVGLAWSAKGNKIFDMRNTLSAPRQVRTLFNPTGFRPNFHGCLFGLLLTWALPVALCAETHAHLQAVTPEGLSAWEGTLPVTLTGVLLCDPDEMLDSTPNFLPWSDGANVGRLGGEWQITFQAVEPGDRGGTTCWMGQNYGNLPWIRDGEQSYSNEAWVAEVLRLNHDPSTGHRFRAGDLIEVTANRSLFYGGKRNLNEAHSVDRAANFTIRLLSADRGLPAPETITLADVMQPGGNPADWTTWPAIFEQTRFTGGEHYQGMRVRINGLALLTTNGWNPVLAWSERLCTVTDGAGRYFRLRLPRRDLGPAPSGVFDALGIFTQESGSGAQGTNGYELFLQQVISPAPAALDIAKTVTVSWPVNGAQYQLEYRTDLNSDQWQPVATTLVVINGNYVALEPLTTPQRFYRLRKTN